MTCEKCGNKNHGGATYCTNCGAPLGWICNCTFINKEEHKYCGGCGISLSGKATIMHNSSKNFDSFIHQYNSKQISNIIQESLYFKEGNVEKLNQTDIDDIFFQDKD